MCLCFLPQRGGSQNSEPPQTPRQREVWAHALSGWAHSPSGHSQALAVEGLGQEACTITAISKSPGTGSPGQPEALSLENSRHLRVSEAGPGSRAPEEAVLVMVWAEMGP